MWNVRKWSKCILDLGYWFHIFTDYFSQKEKNIRCLYNACHQDIHYDNTRHIEIRNKTNTVPKIQGVSRLVGITAGGDFLGLCDQKSLYKHVSDFGWLQSYGHFLIPVHALV